MTFETPPPPAEKGVHWSNEFGVYVDASGVPLRKTGRTLPFAGRVALFLLIFSTLMLGWLALRGTAVEQLVMHDGTVRPAAFLANLITPTLHARAVGSSIRAPGGGLNILNGCEGVDALFMMIAAFFVAPMSGRARIAGLLLGVAMLYGINQIRILLLFFAYRRSPTLFATLHDTVTPILMVLAIAAYFYFWLYLYTPRHAPAP